LSITHSSNEKVYNFYLLGGGVNPLKRPDFGKGRELQRGDDPLQL
jgi:hypothetical protein